MNDFTVGMRVELLEPQARSLWPTPGEDNLLPAGSVGTVVHVSENLPDVVEVVFGEEPLGAFPRDRATAVFVRKLKRIEPRVVGLIREARAAHGSCPWRITIVAGVEQWEELLRHFNP